MNTSLPATALEISTPCADDWSVAMCWHDLLFAHWPIRADRLRSLIPAALEIDTYDDWAWIGFVPFRMTGIRLRRMPNFCSLAFPELNVRTYVRRRYGNGVEKSGVWFLSLDATSRLGVCAAKRWYRLPYHLARVNIHRNKDEVAFSSHRRTTNKTVAALRIRYRPTGEPHAASVGTLEHWLTERYSLFAKCRCSRVARADIHHAPWQLQPAEAEIETNTMLEPLKLKLPTTQPLLHFAERVDAVAWKLH
jgi:uncharacterized protein